MVFNYFIKLENSKIYKEFYYFEYDQLLSLLIAARFVINIISSKNEKCLFYNLLIKARDTTKNNQKYFNEFYSEDFDIAINDKRNINCLTYTIINYIILSHFYFGFTLNLIKCDDLKNVNLFKELEVKDKKEISNYLLTQLFKSFNFIKKTLLPLLGINNIIIFMNSLFKEIHQKLIIFQIDDNEETIKKNEQSIDFIVNTVINNFSISVDEYYTNVKRKNEIFDIIMETSQFYNDKNLINKKYLLLPYFTYSNYTSLNNDFQNQYLYYNNNSSNYPLISSVLYEDDIFKIIDQIPKLNKFVKKVYNALNMRYTKEEINAKTIGNIFKNELNEYIQFFNNIIETNKKLFDRSKKLNKNSKIYEIINQPNSALNYVYQQIIKIYNAFLSKMKFADKKISILDEVIIQEAKENDYNFNYIMKNDYKITIKEKLEELSLLYSKRKRKIKDKINVNGGGRIIYNFESIEKKLEEIFIIGRKKFSKNLVEFTFSSDVFEQEINILKDFEKKYPQKKINDAEKKKMEQYINDIKTQNEKNVLDLFYELFFAIKYITKNAPNIKMKNEKDLIKYLGLKQYEFIHLQKAKTELKDCFSLKTILSFYELI